MSDLVGHPEDRFSQNEAHLISARDLILVKQSCRKVPKFLDARKLCCNLPKIQTKRPNLRVFHQKDANGIANSEDPDQTASLGLHCYCSSRSALFAQTYLSENLGSLRYFHSSD